MNDKGSLLITGGAGFIGSNFVEYIINQKNDYKKIVILDKLTYASKIEKLNLYLDKITFIKGDICDIDLVETIIVDNNIKSIINFAAESHVDNSILDQSEFINSNILGVNVLLNQSKKYWDKINYDNCRFIQISTDEVYGSSSKDNQDYFTEKSPLNPSNPYSATKASADHMINAFINTFDFPAIIIRSSNNYGAFQNSEKLIPKVIEKILKNEDIPVYGDGLQMRTWLYVEDNCKAIYKVLKAGKINNIYNITGKTTITNLELIKLIIDKTEKNLNVKYSGKIEFIKDRLGHDYSYRISGEKIREELDFISNVDIEDGIEKVLNIQMLI